MTKKIYFQCIRGESVQFLESLLTCLHSSASELPLGLECVALPLFPLVSVLHVSPPPPQLSALSPHTLSPSLIYTPAHKAASSSAAVPFDYTFIPLILIFDCTSMAPLAG